MKLETFNDTKLQQEINAWTTIEVHAHRKGNTIVKREGKRIKKKET